MERTKRGKLSRSFFMAFCLCLCMPYVTWAAKSPLISGTETDSGPAEGPGLEDAGSLEGTDSDSADENVHYTEEELKDNLIEYGELDALIRTGNSTAVSAQQSYEATLEMYQSAYDSLESAGRDMLNKADDLEDGGGEEELIASYEQSASILSSSARRMKQSITSLNSRSSQWSREQAVWALVKSAQSLMASCKEMEAQAETAAARAEAGQAAYDRIAAMKTAGLATEEETLTARKNLLSVQSASQSARDNAERLKRQLAIMLGKKAESIQLGEFPQVTAEELAAINPEEDKAMAVIADSSVKSIKRSRARGDTERNLRRQQLEEAEGAACVTADEQYQEIAALSLERDAALAAFAAAEKDYSALRTRYQAGVINKSEYLSGVAEYFRKKATRVTAEARLRTAVDAYGWMLKGVS